MTPNEGKVADAYGNIKFISFFGNANEPFTVAQATLNSLEKLVVMFPSKKGALISYVRIWGGAESGLLSASVGPRVSMGLPGTDPFCSRFWLMATIGTPVL